MTDELLQLVNTKNDLYVDWKKNSKTIIFITKKIPFRAFEKIVNTQIDETKVIYYYNTFQNYKLSMKKTWRTINETLARHKQCNELPTRFKFKGEI